MELSNFETFFANEENFDVFQKEIMNTEHMYIIKIEDT